MVCPVADVVVAGAGPAGWALARACARRGLRTVLVAPHPAARWPATYGLWLDEVDVLPKGARYVSARARVVAGGSRWLARGYAVLDNDSVRRELRHPDVTVRPGRLEDGVVRLAGGDTVSAPVVIDATGTGGSRVRIGGLAGPERGTREAVGVTQTAFGVLVPAEVAAPLAGPDEAIFMDWRQPLPGPATFLYAVPLPDGRVLLEETSLARGGGLAMAELRTRLLARLAAHGIEPGDAPVERVWIPLDGRPGPGFGAAAGMIHPATGYGVADSLRLAPRVADAIATAGPHRAAAAVRRVVWSPRAMVVHRLRLAGLRTLLALPPERTERFFALFFDLPEHRQRGYLSGREDLAGTAAAMARLLRTAPWPLRRTMLTASIR